MKEERTIKEFITREVEIDRARDQIRVFFRGSTNIPEKNRCVLIKEREIEREGG